MSRPLVSVVLPVHRCRDTVQGAVRGVLDQTFGELELIVVDDASGDGTFTAAQEALGGDARGRVLELDRNCGPTLARKAGVAVANGAFVWFVDADDRWQSNAVEVLVTAQDATSADVVVCRATRVERNGRRRVMEGAAGEMLLLDRPAVAQAVLSGQVRGYLWNKLVRTCLLGPVERRVLTSQDDHLMVLEILERASTVVLIPDVLYEYLDQPGSVSNSSRLRLDNVAYCTDRTLEWAERVTGRPVPIGLADHFRTWFLLVPALTTPAHDGWPTEMARDVFERFGPELTWSRVLACLRRDPRRGIHAAAIRLLGRRFGLTYRVVGRAFGFSVRERRADAASNLRSSGP